MFESNNYSHDRFSNLLASQPTMSDFLSRETDILGSEFSTSLHRPTNGDDIDFDRAASAFPDIDLDSGTFIQSSQPPPPIIPARTNNGFSYDFGSPPLSQKVDTQVTVTNDDDFDTFAPQPQPSMFSSTPILTQNIPEDEPQVIKCV